MLFRSQLLLVVSNDVHRAAMELDAFKRVGESESYEPINLAKKISELVTVLEKRAEAEVTV